MFILGTALMLHTHNIALGFLLLANLFLAMVLLPNRNPGGSRRWLLSQVFIVLLWAPALPRLLRPATRAHLAIPDLTWGHLMGTVRELYLPGLGPASAALVLLLLVALAFSALRARTDDPRLRRFAVVFALLPLPLIALVSLAWPLLLPRVLIWTVVPWLVLVGRGALQLQSGFARLGAVALLSGLSLFGLQDYFGHPQKEAWDKAAAHVAQRAETRDLVVFVAGYVDVPFNYYLRRQPVALDQFSGTPGPVGPGHLREIERAVEDRPRVWLVRSHAAAVDPTDSVLATLRRTHPRHDRTAFEGVEVYLMRTHL